LQNSDLIIVAGRPSSGKTAFALSLTRNAAMHHEKPTGVGIFSLEMSTQQLVMRLLCAEAKVDAHAVRTGRLPEDDWKRMSIAAGRLANAKIFIDDTASLGILELRAKARRLKAERDIGMIVVDYLQLMQGPKDAESREKEISAISRSLKALAKELNIPVIALSQLSRAVEARNDKRPILSDLRESGAIEQDADVVAFVHRPEMYMDPETRDSSDMAGMAEIIVGKQRNGPIDDVKLAFVHRYARFENLAPSGFEGGPPPSSFEDESPF
jgi:replicative DNA helicase